LVVAPRAAPTTPDHQVILKRMVDYVIDKEAPLFFDLITDRIREAHEFKRAGGEIRNIVKHAIGRGGYPLTQEGDREIVWPEGASTQTPPRGGSPTRASIAMSPSQSLPASPQC
jgi:hypothetical protein